jgi:hypothetical protein
MSLKGRVQMTAAAFAKVLILILSNDVLLYIFNYYLEFSQISHFFKFYLFH